MLTLFCVVVGEGRPFPVEIDADKSVGILKKKIKEEIKYDGRADELQLYRVDGLAQLGKIRFDFNGAEIDDMPAKLLSDFGGSTTEMVETFSLSSYPQLNDSSVGRIHVLVVVPVIVPEVPLLKVTALEPSVPVHPSVDRKRRFDELNQILSQAEIDASNDTNKKPKKSSNFSSIKWELVAPLFSRVMSAYEQEEKAIPREILQELQDYSARAFTCFELSSCSEATLNIFIAPVLIQVCALFNGDIKIFAEETLKGKYLKANGRFEFVLKRGLKSIFIVEAKKEDFDQGAAQELVGAEVAAELGSLNVVYGIVTNFKEWVFYKSSNTKIEKDASLMYHPHKPYSMETMLAKATAKIYAILSE
ncbi:unnamed protein product [Aphanomyces euteiches]